MGFLSTLVAEVRAGLAVDPLDEVALRSAAGQAPRARSLAETIRAHADEDGVAVIAEVKRASPSAGVIAGSVDPVAQALAYDRAASAISVLTEPNHFGGSLDDLRAIRAAARHPVLRKDFLVHPTQVLEARAAGADSILLIAASLDDDELAAMLSSSRDLGMEPLVETQSDEDLRRALEIGADVIGVNARDLESLDVDVASALERLHGIPDGRIAVLESGIGSRDEVAAAVDAGASAVLVGEALMRAPDPGRLIDDLIDGVRRRREVTS